jgi:glycosyltransferase involved in cell wall biosynthesis
MLKKMFFFEPESQYGVMRHFTKELVKGLEKVNVACKILDFNELGVKEVMDIVNEEEPDCTASINPVRPLKDGSLLCDHLKVPHYNFLVDSSIEFLYLLQSPYSIISCVDQLYCEYLKQSEFKKVFFAPHAAPADLQAGNEDEKVYEISMLATLPDFEGYKKRWSDSFNPTVCKIIERVTEETLSNNKTSYMQGLWRELEANQINPDQLPITSLFCSTELYLKGKARVEMVRAIKDHPIHIFGNPLGEQGWEEYVGAQENVTVHPSVPFEESMDIIKKSKITLNSFPFFKFGSHERLFYGLASGTAVVADETLYVSNEFKEDEGVLFYQPWAPQNINAALTDYLQHDEKRQQAVSRGRDKVMGQHTWDQRAVTIKDELGKILENML